MTGAVLTAILDRGRDDFYGYVIICHENGYAYEFPVMGISGNFSERYLREMPKQYAEYIASLGVVVSECEIRQAIIAAAERYRSEVCGD